MDITECQKSTVAWVNTSSPIKDNVTPPPSHTPGDGHSPEKRRTPKDGHTPSNGNTPKERITAIKAQTSTEIPETTVDCETHSMRSIQTNVSGVRNSLSQRSMHLATIPSWTHDPRWIVFKCPPRNVHCF